MARGVGAAARRQTQQKRTVSGGGDALKVEERARRARAQRLHEHDRVLRLRVALLLGSARVLGWWVFGTWRARVHVARRQQTAATAAAFGLPTLRRRSHAALAPGVRERLELHTYKLLSLLAAFTHARERPRKGTPPFRRTIARASTAPSDKAPRRADAWSGDRMQRRL